MTTPAARTGTSRAVEHTHGTDFLLVVLGGVHWGTGGLAGAALAGRGADMLTVASLRLGLGGGVLLVGRALAGRLGRVPRTRAVLVRVVATAGLAAVYPACYFLAVQMTSVGVATFVALGAAPVIVAGVTALRTRSSPDARTRVAVVRALVGLALLVGVRGGGEWPLLGALLALVAAGAFATMTMVNRRPVAGLGALVLTGTSFTFGAAGVLGALLLASAVAVLRPRRVSPTMAAGLH